MNNLYFYYLYFLCMCILTVYVYMRIYAVVERDLVDTMHELNVRRASMPLSTVMAANKESTSAK